MGVQIMSLAQTVFGFARFGGVAYCVHTYLFELSQVCAPTRIVQKLLAAEPVLLVSPSISLPTVRALVAHPRILWFGFKYIFRLWFWVSTSRRCEAGLATPYLDFARACSIQLWSCPYGPVVFDHLI